MMDAHFWPSMYPGIIVGFLVGLSAGGVMSTVFGTAGGLAGAMALHFLFEWIGRDDSILSLIGLVGGAVLGAYLLMAAGRWITTACARRA